MARKLSLVSFLLFFASGCATLNAPETPDKEVSQQAAQTQAGLGSASEKQTQPVVSNSSPAASVENEAGKVSAPVSRNLTKVQIQVIQDLLRASGFDPGPIDGMLGPKTRAALHQYQSGCAILTNLIGTTDKEVSQQTAETQTQKVDASANKNLDRDQIRLVQERLKASGFDPGPIDGMLGPKTRSALQKYQASNGLSNSGTLDDKTLVSLGAG